MTKLQHLIDTLCPHGVPFKPLGEVGTFIRGNGLQKKDFTESGVGCIHYGQIYTHYGTFASKTISFVSEETANNCRKAMPGDLVIAATSENVDDVCKCVAWLGDEEVAISSDAFVFRHNLNPKYVAYYFQSDCFQKQKLPFVTGTKVMRVSSENLAKILIPIPPLAVQEEIVRILDRFADYSAQLQAELQARKAQYEFYRNHLLAFKAAADGCGLEQKNIVTTPPPTATYKIKWKTMGEIGTVKMCKRIMKNQTSACGDVPFYKIGTFGKEADAYISRELYEDYKKRFPFPSKGTILISAAGTIGRCVIYDGEDAYFQDSNIVWLDNDEKQVLNSYLYHFYQIVDWNTDGGTIKRLYNDNFLATPIPIPPIPVQEEIVAILDRFEALVNDLCSGLPAEIEAVNARYEFYRNHLLAFTPLSL